MRAALKLVLIWLAISVGFLLVLEVAARTVLFHYPKLGMQPLDLVPERMMPTPENLIPEFEKRPRVLSPLLDTHERTRLKLQRDQSLDSLMGDLEPNVDRIYFVSLNHPYRVVTNSAGLRRKTDTLLPKPKDTLRIYCLGDSFTFGPYLPNEETYPNILEHMLDLPPGFKKTEVLNGGVAGHAMEEERDQFVQRGYLSQPDLVILQVLGNDLPALLGDPHARPLNPDQAWPDELPLTYRLKLWLRKATEYSALLRITRHIRIEASNYPQMEKEVLAELAKAGRMEGQVHMPTEQRKSKEDFWTKESLSTTEWQKAARKNEALLQDLQKFCKQKQIALLMVLFPTGRQLRNWAAGRDLISDYYDALAKKTGVPYINLNPLFAKQEDPRILFLWPWNGHLSVWGNALAAKGIAESAVFKNLIEPKGK